MKTKFKMILFSWGSLCIVLISYIVLREVGPCLIAILCGAKITRFSISGVYIIHVGGVFNPVTSALFYAAGMLLPVFISFVFMLFYSKSNENVFYRIFSCIFSLTLFFSVIAWIIVPILYLLGKAPNDDISKFINVSGMSPWLVCGMGILLIISGIIFAWKKKIILNCWNACRGGTGSVRTK
jgi:hypothetical protein